MPSPRCWMRLWLHCAGRLPAFDGGGFSVFYVSGGSADDQLSVRDQGSGFGQVGLVGNQVSFGGVVIGTVSGGTDGAGLQVASTQPPAPTPSRRSSRTFLTATPVTTRLRCGRSACASKTAEGRPRRRHPHE